MKIRLLCVGKPKDATLISLHDRYAERVSRFGVKYDTSWVPETRQGPRFSDEHVREREAREILAACGKTGTSIALNPVGKTLTSESLANRLESWATPQLTLIIGGPLGLHKSVLDKANSSWSLSPLTFPHEIVRALVAEQLYRALTLLRNVPYHK